MLPKLSLDEQLLLFMGQLEELQDKRHKLNSLIEEGWFSIAKARYSMGNKQVSALQYANEMEPLVHVETGLLDRGRADFKCDRKDNKTDKIIEDIGAKETGLRRRIHSKQSVDKEEDKEEDKEKDVKIKPGPPTQENKDPIKWFGILVPQNLKQAQTAFKEVITLSAEIASLQSAILATRKEMQAQMKEKRDQAEKSQHQAKDE
ncbi:hypothetical protein DNTS_033468 [Danionella cerebrum]|uniref:Vacuolar ATPase assembly protein VMA22 n=1 Tax=Danionella cerebrum TaxID=2873325 RepID=A0A553R242_9TELE|nr:hypothetical protein DNTS_033468 [Danionella translucida]